MNNETSNEYIEIGNGFFEKKKFEKAIEYFSKAIEQNPNNAEAFELRGLAKYSLLNIEDAIQDFEKSILIDPEHDVAFYHLGTIFINKDNFEKAEYYYEKAIEISDENLMYLSDLAMIKYFLNKDDECLSICNTILKQSHDDSWALNYRGGIYLKKKKYHEALDDFIKIREKDKNDSTIYNSIGFVYGKMGILDKAEINLSFCIKLNPDYGYAYANLGHIYFLQNKYDKALELINHSIKLDPSNSYAFKNRAIVFLAQSKKNEAKKDFEKAIELGFLKDYQDDAEEFLEKMQSL